MNFNWCSNTRVGMTLLGLVCITGCPQSTTRHNAELAISRSLGEVSTPEPRTPAENQGPAQDPAAQDPGKVERKFTGAYAQTFSVDLKKLTATGRSPYFILEPGYEMEFAGAPGASVTIAVLNETKMVGDIETRVVERLETEDGKLSMVMRSYCAIDSSTGDVYLFGENVDDYEDGKISGHDGTWLNGADGATFGLLIPGAPTAGQRYYQNRAPKVAMDRAEILSLHNNVTVPAGTFENCIKTLETSDLDSDKDELIYAPNVGLVVDGEFKLTRYGTKKSTAEK